MKIYHLKNILLWLKHLRDLINNYKPIVELNNNNNNNNNNNTDRAEWKIQLVM